MGSYRNINNYLAPGEYTRSGGNGVSPVLPKNMHGQDAGATRRA
jgi:hypothetical protein